MKKTILIMLILLYMIIFLSSCNNINQPNNSGMLGESIQQPTEEDRPSNDADNFKDDASEEIQPMPEEDVLTDSPSLTISSYETYEKFIQKNVLPENFVYYDHIKQFGAFDHFVCLSEARYGDYSHYMYTLIDDNGYKFVLYVASDRESPWQPNVIADANENDMRVLSSKESGIYERDGLRYSYVNGDLLSISWQSNELTYTLSGDPMLYNYPVKGTTLVGKMMNVQGALEVLGTKFDLEKQ